ncbi:MAG: SWF/SNF helicase family protein, partial [Clostridium sp.]|nr:SWF/SNF helicase family protein [Clostridium sp.]
FTTMLDLLKRDLDREHIPYFCITGETPKEKRTELVEEFNRGDVPVFLISLRAGGTGLNLTGADVVIHYDPWWNLAVQNQATDRAHRIGQQRKVTVYKLIMKGTVEEKILAMQEAKKKLAEDILGEERLGQGTITKEELLELLSD